MKVAVVGCSHGELDNIYETAKEIECEKNIKIDVLICCGDFQATRNESDLRCMAIPRKYYNMGSFYKYYSGEKLAPILTIFIGGNHEASNYLQELPYGGWVAPKIYYLGYAGVVNVNDIRIGGLSGIYKPFDYMKGHFEKAPYTENTKRSVYHIRNLEIFRLKQISGSIDIMMSHDWPRGVYNYGSVNELIKNKPFFKKEVNENNLGSKPCEELLFHLKPKNWFSAHLHTKFSAVIPHNSDNVTDQSSTNFLALDKCLPRRKWIDVIDIPSSENFSNIDLYYDLEWLTVLYLTDHLTNSKRNTQYMPGPKSNERWIFIPSNEEKEFIFEKMGKDLMIPIIFEKTASILNNSYSERNEYICQPKAVINPQNIIFCEKLGIRDPISLLLENDSSFTNYSPTREHFTPVKDVSFNDSTYVSFDNSINVTCNDSPCVSSYDSSVNVTPKDMTYVSFNDSKDVDVNTYSAFTSTPQKNINKRKFSFPLLKEKDDTAILPFHVDRKGDDTSETSVTETKKVFKRRNGSLYQPEEI